MGGKHVGWNSQCAVNYFPCSSTGGFRGFLMPLQSPFFLEVRLRAAFSPGGVQDSFGFCAFVCLSLLFCKAEMGHKEKMPAVDETQLCLKKSPVFL